MRHQQDGGKATSKIYTEATFEAAIEHSFVAYDGYKGGDPNNFDRERCLDLTILIPFIKETQPAEWEYLTNLRKERTEETLLDDLSRALNSEHEGCLMVLRHGFKCFGKLFRVAYFAPASSMNPETERLYEANRLTGRVGYSCTRGGKFEGALVYFIVEDGGIT